MGNCCEQGNEDRSKQEARPVEEADNPMNLDLKNLSDPRVQELEQAAGTIQKRWKNKKQSDLAKINLKK